MKTRVTRYAIAVLVVLFVYLSGEPALTNAFPVPALPDDNLIVNPWFRSAAEPGGAGLDGWTRPLTDDGFGWGLSQKESNPAPDIVISGRCGNDSVYCGTAARWARAVGDGQRLEAVPDVDVYLYQVVATDSAHRRLKFFSHWVSHRVEIAEVSIYGGATTDGPWTLVWVPFTHSIYEVITPSSRDQQDLWEETGFLQTTLDQGFSHYKVELHARLPEDDNATGFKITGVYFATDFSEESGISPPVINPPATFSAHGSNAEDATALPADDGGEADPQCTPTPADATGTTPEKAPTQEPTTVSGSQTTPTPETGAVAAEEESELAVTTLDAVAISPAEIELSWSPSDNNSRGFFLERSANGTENWVRIGRINSQATSYSDTKLEPNTLHYYRLRISSDATSNIAAAQTLPPVESQTPMPSPTSFSAAIAEQDRPVATDDVTEDESPAAPRPDASTNRPPLLVLLAVPIGAVAVILIAWHRRRSKQTKP